MPDLAAAATVAPGPRPHEALTDVGARAVVHHGDTRNCPVDLASAVTTLAERVRAGGDGGAWVALRPEALSEAAGARPSGPLAGALVGVKDLVAVRGLALHAGSPARTGAPPEPRDAVVVSALRGAGAVVVGTLALHEIALGVTGVDAHGRGPEHPVRAGHVPGGSSSGSAVAVADGDVDLAVGTDTGGSVRIPAALCGVVGYKPARGRYPLDGVFPLSPSLDHVGLLARDVDLLLAAHRVLTDDRVRPARPRRLGVDRVALERSAPDVAAAVRRSLDDLVAAGVELVDVAWPSDAVLDASSVVMFAEAAAVHAWAPPVGVGPAPPHGTDPGGSGIPYGPGVAARLALGAATTADELAAARATLAAVAATVVRVLADLDGVVGPTVPVTAPTIAEAADPATPRTLVAATRLANVAGVPALTLPLPVDEGALPVGLQLVATTDVACLGLGTTLAEWLTSAAAGATR